MWKPENGVRLKTDAKSYPIWTGTIEVPSGTPVEYKYVVYSEKGGLGGSVQVQWEDKISNRMFTPEGVFVLLEDGRFNIERAKLLNGKKIKVSVDREGRTSKYNEYADMEVSLSPLETVYIFSYLLPLKTERSPSTGQLTFSWHPGYTSSTSSRHAMYVLEKMHNLGNKVQIWYIGWLGIEVAPEERESVAEVLGRDFQCLPVFLSASQARDFQNFADNILRPIFHFVAPTDPAMCTTYCKGLDPPGQDTNATPAGPRCAHRPPFLAPEYTLPLVYPSDFPKH
jgi:hypothetical protein